MKVNIKSSTWKKARISTCRVLAWGIISALSLLLLLLNLGIRQLGWQMFYPLAGELREGINEPLSHGQIEAHPNPRNERWLDKNANK